MSKHHDLLKQSKVAGIGIYEKGVYPSYIKIDGKGKSHPIYDRWLKMLQRCQPDGYHQKRKPSYIGVECCPEWIYYQNFAKWCDAQPGFHKGYELDKDAIEPGNKIYCPEKCVFIPREINSLLITNKTGQYGLGVAFDSKAKSKQYKAVVRIDGKPKAIGRYETAEEASEAYRIAKKKLVADAAEAWKSKIDPRGYQALLVWEPGRK